MRNEPDVRIEIFSAREEAEAASAAARFRSDKAMRATERAVAGANALEGGAWRGEPQSGTLGRPGSVGAGKGLDGLQLMLAALRVECRGHDPFGERGASSRGIGLRRAPGPARERSGPSVELCWCPARHALASDGAVRAVRGGPSGRPFHHGSFPMHNPVLVIGW